jgi:hypothetical protein
MHAWPGFACVALALAAAPAEAATRWTFCVAESLDARDVWITDVLVAGADRERLENDLKALLVRQGEQRVVAQCPSPSEDKTAVLNAQTGAEEFNRKLGKSLHALALQDSLSKR